MLYNMRILPYLCPCCGVLAARFSNLTRFECSHRRDAVTHTHDIFNTNCTRPHHITRKISNLYIENKYHLSTLKKNPITFEQGCMITAVYLDGQFQLLFISCQRILANGNAYFCVTSLWIIKDYSQNKPASTVAVAVVVFIIINQININWA